MRDSTRLAKVEFNVGAKSVVLKPALVLDDVALNSKLWAAGNLGNDLHNQSESVRLTSHP